MTASSTFPFRCSKALFLCLFVLFFSVSGCSLKEIQKQTQAVENLGTIQGTIEVDSKQKGPVYVLLFRDDNGVATLLTERLLSKNGGNFVFPEVPGNYYVAAYIDNNKDGQYQPHEHGNFHGIPTKIALLENQQTKIEPIKISGQIPKPDNNVTSVADVKSIWENNGSVVKLNDPRFTRENYAMGLWRPFDFLDIAEGGLFFLQDFQPGKIPLLFVHGVNGGPTDWQTLIAGIDKEHFQPWVLYYPSGLRLDMISDFIIEALSRLQHKYNFSEFAVIAHSMGGLVTRSFVKKYVGQAQDNDKKLKMVMTVNSPMGGMSAAASGVKHSPIVVPSWRDVAPGSDFLQDLHTWNWPKDIPYHLVVSYQDGESGDGVVPLQSQTLLKLQAESIRMYVFNNSHVGTISDNDFQALFNNILAKSLE